MRTSFMITCLKLKLTTFFVLICSLLLTDSHITLLCDLEIASYHFVMAKIGEKDARWQMGWTSCAHNQKRVVNSLKLIKVKVVVDPLYQVIIGLHLSFIIIICPNWKNNWWQSVKKVWKPYATKPHFDKARKTLVLHERGGRG